jgi:hypothetical protein
MKATMSRDGTLHIRPDMLAWLDLNQCQRKAQWLIWQSERCGRAASGDDGFRFPAAVVSCESGRNGCERVGVRFARRAKAARGKRGSTWRVDEMIVKLRGEAYVLSCASSRCCARRPFDNRGMQGGKASTDPQFDYRIEI